jgi:hypothetical protein
VHETNSDPLPPPDTNLLVVWDVEGDNRSASGVTRSAEKARSDMLAALNAMPSGTGRIREARLDQMGEYHYGATLLKARRKLGQRGVRVSRI